MSQNSGTFLAPSHGHPSFNPRGPSLSMPPSLKRPGNGPMSLGSLPNPSLGPNMNVPPSTGTMRPSTSMGPMKPTTTPMNPMDKSNTMPYSSRYTRKAWPATRSMHDKSIRGHDDHESAYGRSGVPSHNLPPENINASSFTIEPAVDDDENEDIYFSSRHMAGARFQRNQRLVAEIFNEVCIPDLRTNVSVERILTLRRQVNALKTHRDTFEKDLKDLEEKHAEKKRKFTEANDKFYSEYAEASANNLSQEKTNEILQKYATMEKLQKEKQLLLQQQQQAAVAAPPPSTSLSSTTTAAAVTPPITTTTITTSAITPTTTVTASETTTTTVIKTESELIAEVPKEETVLTPPPSSVQTQVPPSQPIPATAAHGQSVPSPLPPPPSVPTQLPPTQPPPGMSQMPVQQQQQQQHQPTVSAASQGYPMMQSGGSYASASGYVHPQQAQYRPMINQRPVQYPANVQWQQQQPQQWQTNTYDPRYYNQYPSNVQWTQQPQPQQWPSNPSQQQMGAMSHQPQASMRGPSVQQQTAMYGSNVHYGYGGTAAGWNTGAHPSQQYGYPQNPSYDPSMVSAPPQQQYYSQPQMHGTPQGYEYLPPPQQQQQQPPPQ